MFKLTASNIVKAIALLPKDVSYEYCAAKTSSKFIIRNVVLPDGPVVVGRYNPAKGQTIANAKSASISSDMIWRLANALSSKQPVNVDRIFGASYNTRSVLESLLAHTSEFSMCYPGRVHQKNEKVEIKKGHKHVWWTPEELHDRGQIKWVKTEKTISEIPAIDVTYDAIIINEPKKDVPEGIQRRHAMIQIALLEIGKALGFKNTVAREDQHISYQGKKLIELDYVVAKPNSLQQLQAYEEAANKIAHIDVAWFKNGRLMPAAIEIEHTTGIKSGLDRLKGLQDVLPPFPVRYVIVADESERERTSKYAQETRFQSLGAKFFSYQSVEELYSLCKRRKIVGVTDEFLDSFMEPLQ
jgi:type II restriction enzyme